jgi:Tfp pilus assembly protein PilO
VAVALAVFFAVYRPLGNKIVEAERRHAQLRQTIRDQEVRVEILKKFQTATPLVGKGIEDFMANRIPARREAYSVTDHLIHKVGEASNVKIMGIAFRLDPDRKEPLNRLGLEITAQGNYPSLLKFSHSLETADDIILIREFLLAPGDPGTVNLRLDADVYLTP